MRLLRMVRKNLLLTISLILLVGLLFLVFFGRYLPFVDTKLSIENHRMEDGVLLVPPYEPSETHLIGSDHEGRDLLSVIILGAKETILLVVCITILRYLMALPLSYLAHKRILGLNILVNGFNMFLSYIPTIIIVMVFALLPPILFAPTRPFWILLIVAFAEVGRVAKTLQDDFDQIAAKDYMESGVAVGAGPFRMLKEYYLPFIYGKLAIYMISDLGKVMFLLGQLGFIGIFISQALVQVDPGIFEIQNTSMSWPMLLENAFDDIRGPIWVVFWPAFAMTITIFIFNMLANSLQRALQEKGSFI